MASIDRKSLDRRQRSAIEFAAARIALSTIVMCGTLFFTPVPGARADSNASKVEVPVTLRIDTERREYAPGQPVKVQIKIKYIAPSGTIAFGYDAPWILTKVVVLDSDGKAVPQRRYTQSNGSANLMFFDNPERTLEWNGDQWFDISNWGYRIDKPGTYTISLAPYLGDLQGSPSQLRFTTPTSTFTITSSKRADE